MRNRRMGMVIAVSLFGAAARAEFSPTNVPGLVLWLDASDTSTITTDGAGNVARWNDKSASGFDATQVNSSYRPAYVPDAHGARPMIRFSWHLLYSECMPALGSDPRTIIIAVANVGTNAQNSNHVIHYGKPAIRQAYGIMSSVWAGRTAREWGQHYWNDGFTTGVSSQDGGGYIVAASYYDGVDHFTVNGDAANTFTYVPSAPLNTRQEWVPGGIHIGCRIDLPFGSLAECAKFDMGEVLAFSNAVSLVDRQLIEGYLAHKWKMTDELPSDHPYKDHDPAAVPATGARFMLR